MENIEVNFYKYYACIPHEREIDQFKPEWFLFNKKDAERLCECTLSDDEYGDIMNEVVQITDKNGPDINLTINGIFTGGCGYYVSQELLGKLIDYLTDIYNDYESYFNKYMLKNFERYYEKCRILKNKKANIRPNAKNKKTHEGFIYVMKCMGTYKIGKSKNLIRCGEYTNLPEEPEYKIVEFVDDMDSLEKEIHKKYEGVRRRDGKCEWFDLKASDISDIKKMLKSHIIREIKDDEIRRINPEA